MKNLTDSQNSIIQRIIDRLTTDLTTESLTVEPLDLSDKLEEGAHLIMLHCSTKDELPASDLDLQSIPRMLTNHIQFDPAEHDYLLYIESPFITGSYTFMIPITFNS